MVREVAFLSSSAHCSRGFGPLLRADLLQSFRVPAVPFAVVAAPHQGVQVWRRSHDPSLRQVFLGIGVTLLEQDGVANGNLETVLPVPFRPLTWASCVVLDSESVSHPSLVHVLT